MDPHRDAEVGYLLSESDVIRVGVCDQQCLDVIQGQPKLRQSSVEDRVLPKAPGVDDGGLTLLYDQIEVVALAPQAIDPARNLFHGLSNPDWTQLGHHMADDHLRTVPQRLFLSRENEFDTLVKPFGDVAGGHPQLGALGA